MQELNFNSSEPLYKQLSAIIRSEIDNEILKKGEKIPTEQELSQKYNVSRITVRNALEELTKEDYLVRKQGCGTFVSSGKVKKPLAKFQSFSQMCKSLDIVPGAKVIRCVIEEPTPEERRELEIEEGGKMLVIERIRYADGVPVSVELTKYSEKYSQLLYENLNDNSIFQILKEHYGVVANAGDRVLELVFASYEIAKYLNIPEDYPLLSISGTISDSQKGPIYISKQLIRGDKFKFMI